MTEYGAVVSCVDGRWLPKTMQVAQQMLGKRFVDLHTRPGSTRQVQDKCPVTDEMAHNIAFVSLGLHGVRDILVVKHWDCGAHGGSSSFSGPEEELETYLSDLRRVQSVLHAKVSAAVFKIMAVEPPEVVDRHLEALLEQGLSIHYAVLAPRDLRLPTPKPEDCHPLVLQ